MTGRPVHRGAASDRAGGTRGLTARALVILVSLAGCAGGSRAPAEAAPEPTDSAARSSMVAAQEIAQLHVEWRDALAKRDTVFLARTLLDNFQLTGGQAALTKPQFLLAVVSDTGGVAPSRFEQTSVRLYGNVAIVTGLIRYDLPGEAGPALSRYTEVWVKESGKWRAAHLHYNPVPPAESDTRGARARGAPGSSHGTQP